MEHLRFPGLFQCAYLRHAFQSLFLTLGGFGGPEKDRKFWCGLLLYCVMSAEVPGSSSSPFSFPRYSVC